MQEQDVSGQLRPRRRSAIWAATAVALVICALPSIYEVSLGRRTVVAEEKIRLSHAIERIEHIFARYEAATTQDAVATFNRLADVATPSAPGSSLSLVSSQGLVIAREPDFQIHVGKDVARSPAFSAHVAGGGRQSAHIAVSALDETPKIIVIRTLTLADDSSLHIVAARDMAETMAAWRHHVLLEAAQFGCLFVAIVFFAGMAARREGRLQELVDAHAQREALYHSLFQGNKAVKLLIDPATGNIIDANAAACAFYGYDIQTLLKMRIGEINTLNPEELATEIDAAKSESRSHFYFRHRLASGQIRDVEVHSGPVEYGGRNLLYSIVHDITERRALEKERARLFTAIEQSPASIIITDEKGDICYVNPAFTRISGYQSEEIIGQNPRILKSGHTSDEEYTRMWRAISSGESYSAIFHNKMKDGGFYWEHAQISPVFDENGNITNYVGVKENVTELKRVEDSLLNANQILENQAEKLKSVNAELEQFAYVASHDLRQPLRTISSYLQIISKKLTNKDDEIREYIDFAIGGAKRLDQLIVGLLEYSRIGRKSGPDELVDIGELIETAKQTYALDIEAVGGTLEVASPLPAVMGDAIELLRLFNNLIGNAVKYRSPDRPLRIDIGASSADDVTMIWVADNGVGIAPADHERAFAMFQRLVPRESCEGAGIGLAICKKIAERHKGGVHIETVEGGGSRFIVTLPLAAERRPA